MENDMEAHVDVAGVTEARDAQRGWWWVVVGGRAGLCGRTGGWMRETEPPGRGRGELEAAAREGPAPAPGAGVGVLRGGEPACVACCSDSEPPCLDA